MLCSNSLNGFMYGPDLLMIKDITVHGMYVIIGYSAIAIYSVAYVDFIFYGILKYVHMVISMKSSQPKNVLLKVGRNTR